MPSNPILKSSWKLPRRLLPGSGELGCRMVLNIVAMHLVLSLGDAEGGRYGGCETANPTGGLCTKVATTLVSNESDALQFCVMGTRRGARQVNSVV